MSAEDSRLNGYNLRVTHPSLPLERTFCIVCGKPKGWVSLDSGDFIRANNVLVVHEECAAKLSHKESLSLLALPEYEGELFK